MTRWRRLYELRFRRAFWAAAILTVLLWVIPFGEWIIYPLSLLGTWVHELGHGLAALVAGGSFHELTLRPDLSGQAVYSGVGSGGGRALAAAGGLLFPALFGFAMLTVSARQSLGNGVLAALLAVLVLSLVLWVRNPFGIAAGIGIAAAIGYSMWRLSSRSLYFVVILISLQVGLSGLRNWRYLFTSEARTGQPSDTAQIAQSLGGPVWLWGAILLALNFALLYLAYRLVQKRIEAERLRLG
ncbi:MAG: M50 family metallopeptidase [Polyangia bacterium]|mgnify:CR=1 FL=1|jgi:hypothetical protein|nr:M50 family metallopeptidase [Polyangia bacterium]